VLPWWDLLKFNIPIQLLNSMGYERNVKMYASREYVRLAKIYAEKARRRELGFPNKSGLPVPCRPRISLIEKLLES
jgi:hypothetical protein